MIARFRAAEAYVEQGDRDAAGHVATAGLNAARALGSSWLETELAAKGN